MKTGEYDYIFGDVDQCWYCSATGTEYNRIDENGFLTPFICWDDDCFQPGLTENARKSEYIHFYCWMCGAGGYMHKSKFSNEEFAKLRRQMLRNYQGTLFKSIMEEE